MKSGKTLEVFQVKDKYLNRFRQEAKRYRIAYHIVKDKNDPNQCADIIVDSNNARMCNRIIERYNLQIDMENTKGEVNNEVKETKEISSNTSEQIVEVEEGKDGVSNNFLQEDNPYESILKNKGEFEIKEKMPLKEALDKLKELFSKTRQKIMSVEYIDCYEQQKKGGLLSNKTTPIKPTLIDTALANLNLAQKDKIVNISRKDNELERE